MAKLRINNELQEHSTKLGEICCIYYCRCDALCNFVATKTDAHLTRLKTSYYATASPNLFNPHFSESTKIIILIK